MRPLREPTEREKDLASRIGALKGLLTAGGPNREMLAWFREYKTLEAELKEEKRANQATSATEQPPKEDKVDTDGLPAGSNNTKSRYVAFWLSQKLQFYYQPSYTVSSAEKAPE